MHYIGICDFPSGEQALKTVEFFQNLCKGHRLGSKLMVGVMMSFKTLTGQPSKWTAAWPKNEEIAGIFVEHPAVLNTLHFADYDGNTTVWHLLEAAKFGGPRLQAIQLDMIWPPDVIIKGLKRKFPHLKMVLQINTHALEIIEDSPGLLVERLKKYGNLLDYVLLDKSHGRGVGMDAQGLLPFVRAISDHLSNLQVGVAGGLGPSTMDLVLPVVYEFPNVSIDAQGKLRPSGSALDPIDWEMAHEYLSEAVTIFSC
jgi:hypothetical protein